MKPRTKTLVIVAVAVLPWIVAGVLVLLEACHKGRP
jgi:hypothetical protein